jgi:hypothetical protein
MRDRPHMEPSWRAERTKMHAAAVDAIPCITMKVMLTHDHVD